MHNLVKGYTIPIAQKDRLNLDKNMCTNQLVTNLNIYRILYFVV